MKEKVLITGATGFIGSHMVKSALENNYEVYAAIRPSSHKDFLKGLDVQYINLDYSSHLALKKQFQALKESGVSFDYVIHNAGLTRARQVAQFYKVNYENTRNLVRGLEHSGMNIKKFIFMSSLSVFGPGRPDFEPIKISNSYAPISAYAKSKWKAELFLKTHAPFPYLIMNPTAVYGPRDKDFLEFVKLINKGWEPYLGREKQMTSMIYVKDLAIGVVSILKKNCQNRSYIIDDGSQYNKEEIGTIIKRYLQKKTTKIKVPKLPIFILTKIMEAVCGLFGQRPFLNTEKLKEISSINWLCDSSEFWNDLGLKPAYQLDKGLEETLAWYKENKLI